MTNMMTKTCFATLCAALMALPACYEEVGDLNALDFNTPPTPTLIAEKAAGVMVSNRAGKSPGNGYVSTIGVLGRESYNFDPADPRFRSELLEVPELDAGSPAFGGNFWTGPYGSLKDCFTLLKDLDIVAGLTPEELNAARGFVLTIMAHEFLTIINTRDSIEVPIDVDRDVNDDPAPLVSKAEVFAEIIRLLDEANRVLSEGGDSFPFPLHSGFSGFDTPAAFSQFTNALLARAHIYNGDAQAALAALDLSFISDSPGDFDLGVYWVYNPAGSDAGNGLTSPNLVAHPSLIDNAQDKADSEKDDRVTSKLTPLEAPQSVPSSERTYSATHRFAAYLNQTDPIPVIRNEELILIRAEANILENNLDTALQDLNLVRVSSGGLEPLGSLPAEDAINELLYNRRYSLLYEGGHSWVDYRRFDRLDDLLAFDEEQLDDNGDPLPPLVVHLNFPLPVDEVNARQ